MESLEGIMIATTNLTSNMDSAFERRFLYKIRFDKPDASVRSLIWQQMIPELTATDATTLAAAYDFSGGQIENVVRKSLAVPFAIIIFIELIVLMCFNIESSVLSLLFYYINQPQTFRRNVVICIYGIFAVHHIIRVKIYICAFFRFFQINPIYINSIFFGINRIHE